MTTIKKPIRREVRTRYLNYREKTYIAEISQDGISMREKGTRSGFAVISWEHILDRSVKIAIATKLPTKRTRAR